jgi:hypothetical protein
VGLMSYSTTCPHDPSVGLMSYSTTCRHDPSEACVCNFQDQSVRLVKSSHLVGVAVFSHTREKRHQHCRNILGNNSNYNEEEHSE